MHWATAVISIVTILSSFFPLSRWQFAIWLQHWCALFTESLPCSPRLRRCFPMSRTIPLFCLFTAGTLAACRDEPTATAFPAVETSAAASITPEPQRAKWRFKLAGDYSAHSPGIGADGTVYVGLSNGKLYAIAPDGTQRWVVPSAPTETGP